MLLNDVRQQLEFQGIANYIMGINIQNLTGQRLGRFGLKRLLGTGGMSAVYLAYQINLKRHVAVKVLRQELAEREQYIQRFTEEAEIAAKLTHPNIVPIFDFGFSEGISYIAMQLLTGGSLWDRMRDRVAEGQPVCSLHEAAELIRQVGGALDFAHSQGVIHRDIKPSNIMFDDQGNAFLVDFGIAVLQDKRASAKANSADDDANTVMGTYAYIAPEMWQGEKITPAIDQYALGLILYTLVTGHAPFDVGLSEEHRMRHKHMYEMPVPAHLVRSDIPVAVTEIIERAIAKHSSQRFPSCLSFAEALENAVKFTDASSTRRFALPTAKERFRKRMLGDESTPSKPLFEQHTPPTPPSSNAIPVPAAPAASPNVFASASALQLDVLEEETRVAIPGERILNMLTDEHLTRNIGRPPQNMNMMARSAGEMQIHLFVSYRPEDTGQTADEITARLRNHFGAKAVTQQKEDYRIGTNVKKHYRGQFQRNTVMVLIIGKYWFDAVDQFGARKLERPNDAVRAALEAAIEAEIRVIPVFVDGISDLNAQQLPTSIRDVIYHTGTIIHPGASFDNDVLHLMHSLEMLSERR
jgi:serine/threonine protein kinase